MPLLEPQTRGWDGKGGEGPTRRDLLRAASPLASSKGGGQEESWKDSSMKGRNTFMKMGLLGSRGLESVWQSRKGLQSPANSALVVKRKPAHLGRGGGQTPQPDPSPLRRLQAQVVVNASESSVACGTSNAHV